MHGLFVFEVDNGVHGDRHDGQLTLIMFQIVVLIAEHVVDQHVALQEEEVEQALVDSLLKCQFRNLNSLLPHLAFFCRSRPNFLVHYSMTEEESNLWLLTIRLDVFLHVVGHSSHVLVAHVVSKNHGSICLIRRPRDYIVVSITCSSARDIAIVTITKSFMVEEHQVRLVNEFVVLLKLRRMITSNIKLQINLLLLLFNLGFFCCILSSRCVFAAS